MMTVEEYSEILHELQEAHADDDDDDSDNMEIWEKKREKERSDQ
jgi:hypothetical protein